MNYNTIQFSFKELPVVNNQYQLYCTIIIHSNTANNNTINAANIVDVQVVSGNLRIDHNDGIYYVTPIDNLPFTLLCTANTNVDNIGNVSGYFYSKAVFGNVMPNNYQSLVRKFPLGVFKSFNDTTLIGTIIYATASLLTDWYRKYFTVKDELFSNQYSQDLEYELNSTNGLLSNSVYLIETMRLLNSLVTYQLNAYDVELFVSQYIWYRIGTSCAVYIDQYIINPNRCWILGSKQYGILDQTTILQDEANITKTSVVWYIYNSSAFTKQFKSEIKQLIFNISRCDIGNIINYANDVTPPLNQFDYIGYTYKNDIRISYGKCIQFTGQQDYPLNIKGYINKLQE